MNYVKNADVISTETQRKEKSHPRERAGNSKSLGEGEISRSARNDAVICDLFLMTQILSKQPKSHPKL